MRLQLSKYIKDDEYFLHADMWNVNRFPINGKVINCGLGESNLLNIAGGLSSQGKIVYVYGVCGFIIHKLEQLKFSCSKFGANYGKIIICNAGKYGYNNLGIGHILDDDESIMNMLGIPYLEPETHLDLKTFLDVIEIKEQGIWYIKLGKDN